MDIRKLQRVIVDALEDVKAQHIEVIDTEEQSPLFERVIIASGTSNRQTKALASSVCEAVKSAADFHPRVEGEENGEWIIVDCGAAVVHVMQPAIRDYYHLEEIWGAKPVRLKMGALPAGLVKASVSEDTEDKKAPAKKAAAKKVPAKKVSASKAPAKKVAAKVAPTRAPAKKAVAAQKVPSVKNVVNPPEAKKPAAKKAPAAARKTPAAKKTRSAV